MNFFGLLLCSIMALSVLTAPNGRQAAVPMARRSLGNELKESWMAHQRRQAGSGTSGATGLAQLIGGTVTRSDVTNLAREFLRSSVVPGAAPTTSRVGKTKAQEIFTRLEAAEKAAGTSAVVSPKSAQTFLRILRRIEGGSGAGAARSSKPARRQATPAKPSSAAPASPAKPSTPAPASSGAKTVKDLLKSFIDSLPAASTAGSASASRPAATSSASKPAAAKTT
ncbi:hypothetical protein PCANC_15954 [Puccinia coronata f. sp. avenae]|uniref:Altered inheritance of mitochondria protein 41 n=2 Tax=Puccinia coronata f. sp. avenae TaxID=200324 RepID=A0A2N5SMH9_9BASI|nr:hypothetical protein PCANC_15954 [Puccinia coronata f. sp. avenae]